MAKGPVPFKTKVCPGCGKRKLRASFYKKKTWVSYRCKVCSLADSKRRAPKYFGRYAEYQNAWRQNRYTNEAAYRERIAANKKTSYDRRVDEINAKRRHRWETDPNNPARLYFRRKDVKLRTPHWVDRKALLVIYGACPKGMEVDHIVPLKGRIDGCRVSGLHVPWNLQYLTKEANRKKANRVTHTDILIQR